MNNKLSFPPTTTTRNERTMRTSKALPWINNNIVMVLLLCFFVNVVSADVKIDSSVMDMPDRCESCRVSVGDFQKESNKIPLKVVS